MTGWIKGRCEANGIEVHYIRTGGDKPPVVLLHGLMLNGACWTPLARELEKDYDVIMPDARGHGYSSVPEYGYCYKNLSTDVVDLIEALGLDTPVLLGHSMGGMTAAVVASQYRKRLRGVILADPTFLTLEHQREIQESDVAEQHCRTLNQSKKDYLVDIQVRHFRRSQEVNELFAQARLQTNIRAFEILTPPNPEYKQLIRTLDVPSLLIVGGVGSVVTAEMVAEFTGLNKYLETIQIPEDGHAVPYDQPERFSAVVQTFLRSLSS